MHWFMHPARETVQPVPADPSASLEAEFAALDREYVKSEREFSEAAVAVARHLHQDAIHIVGDRAICHLNSMQRDPQFAELCHVRAVAMRKRNELLQRRAELLTRMGKI